MQTLAGLEKTCWNQQRYFHNEGICGFHLVSALRQVCLALGKTDFGLKERERGAQISVVPKHTLSKKLDNG